MKINQPVLGFIGMGLMGIPMSLRLIDAGFPLVVWNRTAEKCKTVVEAGAAQVNSITELLDRVDIIMLCVSNTKSVQMITTGKGQQGNILDHLRSSQTVIDFSSISPEATQDIARQVEARGAHWIDSPVSGGVAGAEQGTLAIMCGGDAKVIESMKPVLAPLSQRVTRMGPVGSGQVTKLCNQMIVSCNLLVMAEALAMAENSGVDITNIPTALQGGFADSIPLQLTGTRMAEKDFDEVKWHVKTLMKDLNMATDFADANQSTTPMAALGSQLMRLHGRQGYADLDPATLIRLYEEKSS